jgi:hypothetical protein
MLSLKFHRGIAPFGPMTCMSRWFWDLHCALFIVLLGFYNDTDAFWNWSGSCGKCGRTCQGMNSLFCANFASSRMSWKPCHSVWHGCCYEPHPLDSFYHHVVADEDGFDWRPLEDLTRHKQARDWDHLITTVQCDLCCFRNLQQRDPIPSLKRDTFLLCCLC